MSESTRRGFYFSPACAKCGMSTGIFEVLGPHDTPERFGCWDARSQRLHTVQTRDDGWRMLIAAGELDNGVVGESIDLDDDGAAELHRRLASGDLDALDSISDDRLGHCEHCGNFYCQWHWTGRAPSRCPEGHARP